MAEKIKGTWGIFFPCGNHEACKEFLKKLESNCGLVGVVIKVPHEHWKSEWDKRQG